jgi:hypothetical protein
MPKINKNVARIEKPLQYLTNKEAELLGFEKEGNDIPAYVYLKYYDNKYQCFSEWSTEELRQLSLFVEKLRSTTWINIYKSGASSGNKAGLGYTICKNTKLLPNQSIVNSLSPDVTFFELRVSSEARVHGFRSRAAFCLIWLDRNHEIYN